MLSRLSAISGTAARHVNSQKSLLVRASTFSAYRSSFHTSTYNNVMNKIVYTHADEAPALATYSLLPIIQRFAKPLGVSPSFHFIIHSYILLMLLACDRHVKLLLL